MKKKFILIPVIICAVIILMVVGIPRTQAFARWQMNKIENLDSGFDFEQKNCQAVLDFKEHHDGYETTTEETTKTDAATLTIFKDPEKAGKSFIPENAKCGEVGFYKNGIYFDYFIGDLRYIVEYNTDGSIEKSFRYGDQKQMFELSTKSDKIKYTRWH